MQIRTMKSWDEIHIEIQKAADEALGRQLPVYCWSLEGGEAARGPGWGWKLQLHLVDSSQAVGTREFVP